MAQNELNLPFFENPVQQSLICSHCGKTAEIHLTLLADVSHQGQSFCLPCSETFIHELRAKPGAFDDHEHGIIYWEGHGWSSDGPFAGA